MINLSQLNRHIITSHFKMKTLDSVHLALRKNDWAISLDLTDAYFHILMQVKEIFAFRFHGENISVSSSTVRALSSLGIFQSSESNGETLLHMGMRLHASLDDWLQPSWSQVISLTHREQLI